MTVKEQQEWKIPPCISNWKNAKVVFTQELIRALGFFTVCMSYRMHATCLMCCMRGLYDSFYCADLIFSATFFFLMCSFSFRATPFLWTSVWLQMVEGCKLFTSTKTLPSWPRHSTSLIERYCNHSSHHCHIK